MLLRCYSKSLSIVLRCRGQLLNVIFLLLEHQVYSVARLYPGQSFLSLCHRRRVAGLSMLYKVNGTLNHCLCRESASYRVRHAELRPQLFRWSLNEGVEVSNLQGVSCRPRFECGMTFPTLCLTPERQMGSRVPATVCCFPELCFLQFSDEQVLVGLRKQFINNFVFPSWACAAPLFNNNYYY